MIFEHDKLSSRVKFCFWVIFTIIIAYVFGISSVWATPNLDDIRRSCQQSNACYYNSEGNVSTYCGDTGSYSGTIAGKDNMLKIANYLVTANIEGISDNPAAIAGLLANFQSESTFNPYSRNSSGYYGLYQTNDAAVISATAAIGEYWGQQAPEDINDKALKTQLDFLVNDKVFPGRWPTYVNAVRNANKSDVNAAQMYAEFFLVAFERAIWTESSAKYCTPLIYQESKDLVDSLHLNINAVTKYLWQATEERRNNATIIYGELIKTGIVGNAESTSDSTSTSGERSDGSDVTIIGDSITDGSKAAIEKILPKADINSKVGRQFAKAYGDDSGYANLKRTIDDNKLRNILVFALGSNDKGLTQDQINEVLSLVNNTGDTHQIILMTSYEANNPSAYAANNAKITAVAKDNDNVSLLDWASAVAADPSKYISSDNLHPTAAGQELFAELMYNTVNSITTGLKASINQDDCFTTGGSPYTSNEIPQYFQCDSRWGSLMYGPGGIHGSQGTSICNSGCAPTSFAMMATVLRGIETLPSETADIAGKKGMHYFSGTGWEGSKHTITQALAEHYNLQYKALDTCDIDTINKYLRDGWMIHTSGSGSAPFSANGHYIGITSVDSSGNWFVADSGNTSRPNQYYSPSALISAGMRCDNVKAIK